MERSTIFNELNCNFLCWEHGLSSLGALMDSFLKIRINSITFRIIKIVIFHCYVSLPEGTLYPVYLILMTVHLPFRNRPDEVLAPVSPKGCKECPECIGHRADKSCWESISYISIDNCMNMSMTYTERKRKYVFQWFEWCCVTEVALVYLPNAADAALLLSKLKAGNLAGSSVNSRFRMRRFDMIWPMIPSGYLT